MTEQEIAGEINGYKQQLEQSDYKVMKAVERIFSASSITDLLSAIAAAAKEVAEIISQRQTWRDRINELEAMEPDQPGSAAGVASAPSGALFFCQATPRGQSRRRFEEVRKRMTDVLEIFAPYGPGRFSARCSS